MASSEVLSTVDRIQGEFGQPVLLRIRSFSLVGATSVVIEVRRPDRQTRIWTPTWDESTGAIRYVLQAGDLEVAGLYRLQVRVRFGSIAQYRTLPGLLKVGPAEIE